MQTLPWGTTWELVRAADDAADWVSLGVRLDLQDDRVAGRAPVNRYFGSCREPEPGRLEIGPVGMTLMAGPPAAMAAEHVFLRRLEAVRGYRADDEQLLLLDSTGVELLAFVPAPERP
jgi:heat shock protein HslJ